MPKEYVFWFKLIKRNAFYLNFVWDTPKNLMKVIVTEGQIKLDTSLGIGNQDCLSIDLPNIDKVTWSVSSPGTVGYVEIITLGLGNFYLTPVNPLDPTMTLVQGNTDELIAFCDVVNALKTRRTPEFDENPYVRQFQKKDKPVYITGKEELHWDKNVSPLEYYYQYVPAKVEKKRRLAIKIYKTIIVGVLSVSIIGFLCALYFNFKW
jgi:hypothetical protein